MNGLTPEQLRTLQLAKEWMQYHSPFQRTPATHVTNLLEIIEQQGQLIEKQNKALSRKDQQVKACVRTMMGAIEGEDALVDELQRIQIETDDCWKALCFDVETMPLSITKNAIIAVREGLDKLDTSIRATLRKHAVIVKGRKDEVQQTSNV